MSGKYNIFHGKFVKHADGTLKPSDVDKAKYKIFLEALEPGQSVGIFFEANEDDGTFAQLARVHASIRELAKATGHSFVEMKKIIKQMSGLCLDDEQGEEHCKSFADCSKDELGIVIQAINTAGESVGVNFH